MNLALLLAVAASAVHAASMFRGMHKHSDPADLVRIGVFKDAYYAENEAEVAKLPAGVGYFMRHQLPDNLLILEEGCEVELDPDPNRLVLEVDGNGKIVSANSY